MSDTVRQQPTTEADGQWLRALTGTGAHSPASHPPLVAHARDVLGQGLLDWAIDLGHAMATAIIAEIPVLGGGDGAFETLRMGTEAASLRGLMLLVTNDPAAIAVGEESLEGDREFVRRGISLDKVLRGIRLGHSILIRAVLDAAAILPEPPRTAEMSRSSELLFDFIDAFSSGMSDEFTTEHDRWVTSAAAERAELVRRILDGDEVDVADASSVLDYPVHRYHRAVVLWVDNAAARTDLQRSVIRLLSACDCSALLVIPNGAGSVWAWASWRTPDADRPPLVLPTEPGIKVALGRLSGGLAGFRESHRQATQTAALSRSADGRRAASSAVTWYSEVELAVLLSRDLELARAFITRQLGPLAADSPANDELRETLVAYLACDRSLVKAAEILHVARNTVAYRVKKAEQAIGRDLRDHRLELECALRLTQSIGTPVLETVTKLT